MPAKLFTSLLIFTLLQTGCRKKAVDAPETPAPYTSEIETGLPENMHQINGYLYAGHEITRLGNNYASNGFLNCCFGDPTRNLMVNYNHISDQRNWSALPENTPNVNVGRAVFNGIPIGGFSQTVYNSAVVTDSSVMASKAVWSIDGNKSFVTFTVNLPRKLPLLLNTSASFSFQASKGFTVDVNSLLSGHDSAAVYIHGGYGFPVLYKSVSSTESLIVFTVKDLAVLKERPSATISIIGYNYAHQTISDKRYVFELSSKLKKMVTISP